VTPRTRWHLITYAPAAILAGCTAPSLIAGGQVLAALAVLFAALAMAAQAWSFRPRYKRGWHDGRMDLLRELAGDTDQGGAGLAPEPWAPRPYAPGIVVRHHPRPRPDCPDDHRPDQ
jgi:hypothetical protein